MNTPSHQALQRSWPFLRSLRTKWRIASLVVFLLVAYGLVFGGGYGASTDEPSHAKYGRETLQVYLGQLAPEATSVNPAQHGPFYSFVSYYAGQWIVPLRPGWLPVDGRHFVYYLSFIMATFAMGSLVRRYTHAWVAWVVAALFFTQPLLLGQAFINPKDIPFMAFFLGSLSLGMLALPVKSATEAAGPLLASPSLELSQNNGRSRRPWKLLLGWTAIAVVVIGLLWLWHGLLPLLQSILTAAYRNEAPWPIEPLFNAVATDAYKTPLDLYQAKLAAGFGKVRLGLTIVLILGSVIGWARAAWLRVRPFVLTRAGIFLVAGAGVLLGMDTSIRAVAPLAAVPLVVLYLRYGGTWKKALQYTLVLAVVSITVTLATWPYLWRDPLGRYIQSVTTLANFPWQGKILFNGQILSQGQQPWYYIPELIALQMTLPVLALAIWGVATFWRWMDDSRPKVEVGLLTLTMALPVLISFRPGTIVYGNFRQFLFTVPALFLLAGLGLESLSKWLSDSRWRACVAALALLPGLVGIIRLHPYEYVYYNAMARIQGPVSTQFESDYWCTSYREAMDWVDTHAPKGAVVEVGNGGVIGQVWQFARSDLTLVKWGEANAQHSPTLAVVCDGKGGNLHVLPNALTLMKIERNGAVLAEVKELRP